MSLLFSICRKLSDWRLQLDISRKSYNYILLWAEHTAMSKWSLCTWGFHSHFFFLCHDCSPWTQLSFGGVRVAWNKARSLFAWNLMSFALCYYVIGLLNRVQTNHKHKRKRMWFGCEQPFRWGSIAWHPKKTAAEETFQNTEERHFSFSKISLYVLEILTFFYYANQISNDVIFFSFVMIVAREHSPVLVACVWRETS